MGIAGHAFDAINRIQQNRAMLPSKQRRRAKIRQMYYDSLSYYSGILQDRKFTPEELRMIKSEIREKIRKENMMDALYFVVTSALVFCVLGSAMYLMLTMQAR